MSENECVKGCLFDPMAPRDELFEFWQRRFEGYYDSYYKLCSCRNPRIKVPSPYKYMAICATCDRPYRHHLIQCVMCESIWIKDFVHPGYCHMMPTCWDCTIQYAEDRVCRHIPPYLRKEHLIIPPQIKKRDYSDVEFDEQDNELLAGLSLDF